MVIDDKQSRIVCAAIKLDFPHPGYTSYGLGINHGAIIGMLSWYRETFNCKTDHVNQDDEGFIAWNQTKGHFYVDRAQAYIIAKDADQLLKEDQNGLLDSYACQFDQKHWPQRAYISFKNEEVSI